MFSMYYVFRRMHYKANFKIKVKTTKCASLFDSKFLQKYTLQTSVTLLMDVQTTYRIAP